MKALLLKLVQTDWRHQDVAVLALRLFVGVMMLTHGYAKLSHFSTLAPVFPDPLGIGSTLSLVLILFAEVGCSLLLMAGFMTRLATLPLMFGMIVAFFGVHANMAFSERELPLMYLGIYFVLLWTGGCHYSIDEIIRKKLTRQELAQ